MTAVLNEDQLGEFLSYQMVLHRKLDTLSFVKENNACSIYLNSILEILVHFQQLIIMKLKGIAKKTNLVYKLNKRRR